MLSPVVEEAAPRPSRNHTELTGRSLPPRDSDLPDAGAGWAEQHDVAGFGSGTPPEVECGDLLAGGGLGVEVELLQGLDGGEPGGADAQPGAGGVAGGDLAVQDRGEVVLVGPARRRGPGRPAGPADSVIRGALRAAAR
ncbi:MAG: hypothetical protein V9G04_17310 [Nocardioides sp.]